MGVMESKAETLSWFGGIGERLPWVGEDANPGLEVEIPMGY